MIVNLVDDPAYVGHCPVQPGEQHRRENQKNKDTADGLQTETHVKARPGPPDLHGQENTQNNQERAEHLKILLYARRPNHVGQRAARPGLLEIYKWNDEAEARKNVKVYGPYDELLKNAKQDGLEAVRIAEAVIESARSGRPVALKSAAEGAR